MNNNDNLPSADLRYNKRAFRVQKMLERYNIFREMRVTENLTNSPAWDDLAALRTIKDAITKIQRAVRTKGDGSLLEYEDMGMCANLIFEFLKQPTKKQADILRDQIEEIMRAISLEESMYPVEMEVLVRERHQISMLEASKELLHEYQEEARQLYGKQDCKWDIRPKENQPPECCLAAKQRRVFMGDVEELVLTRMEQLRSRK